MMDAASFGPLPDIALLNGYGYRTAMHKLNTFPLRRRHICFSSLCGTRPTAVILIIVACLCGLPFANSAQAQPPFDLSTETFTSHSGLEEEIVWDTDQPNWLSESHFGDPFALGCTEAMCADEDKSICVIKNRWGCTERVAIRPQDEIWIVSARNCCTSHCEEALEVKRLSSGVWQPSSLEVLGNCHQTKRSLSTLVYVHGNQTDYVYGMSRGVQFYHNFVSCQEDVGPLRIVLWLWKSEQEQKRLYPDFLIKSQRAIQMGEPFKATLQGLGDSRIALIGFSLGTQVIASALDSMEADQGITCSGFSENACCELGAPIPQENTSADKYRIALIAPALDPAYACSVADRKVCSTLTARTTAFFNRSDRAVKALRIVFRRECTDRSVTLNSLLEGQRLNLGPVRTVDLTWEAGARHSIVKYSRTPSLCRELSRMLAEVTAANFRSIQSVPTSHFAVE